MRTLVVFRLSSMGDVLLALPVILGALKENPRIRILFVTDEKFAPYFQDIDRLEVIPFDARGRHLGFPGLMRLFRMIRRSGPIGGVIDLHAVVRTHVLDFLFLLRFVKVVRIKKHRSQRRAIVKHRESPLLPHTVIRYVNAFRKAGFKVAVVPKPMMHLTAPSKGTEYEQRSFKVGIAPLARHRTKMWGDEPVARLLSMLGEREDIEVHLFGGADERQILLGLACQGQRVEAGLHHAVEEVRLISGMDVFLSMDSANMHLASLAGVPTLSIWGGTHPGMGFSPVNQPPEYQIQASREEVACRPCSVYGENPCHLKEDPMRCMRLITPEQVLAKILRFKVNG